MKYLFSLLLLTSFYFQSQAQRNFKPGFIVSLNGDTTKGFIDYREWNQNPRNIFFKTAEEAATQQYSANNIKAFGISQFEHYQQFNGSITTGAVDLADLSSGIDSSYVTDIVFLRVISGGDKLTLYSYNDKIKNRFFIADGELAPVELRRYVYKDTKQSTRIGEFNFYTQQMLALGMKYAPNNTSLIARIEKAAYKESVLEDIVLELNGNIDRYKEKNKARRSGSDFFIGLSANSVNSDFGSTEIGGFIENVFSANTKVQQVRPVLSAGMNFYFNKNIKKLVFRTEINFTTNNINANYSGFYVDNINRVDRTEQLTFNQIAVGFSPQFIYNVYNTNKLKLFIGAGAQASYYIYSNKHWYYNNTMNGKADTKGERDARYKNTTTGIVFKTGVTLKNKFDIYLGYGIPVQIINHQVFGIDMSYYRFGINYIINKK